MSLGQEGRALAANGNVLQWEYQAPFLRGTVRTGGGATINARIKLGTRATEVDSLRRDVGQKKSPS